MKSIQTMNMPLACPVALPVDGLDPWMSGSSSASALHLHTVAGAMEGMQKQALVVDAASQRIWNFACDEGPYLNGTDLAPFPLAYFNSGLGFSLFCEIETLAHARGVRLDDLELCLDSFYGMEGSALKGTMTGSALPPVLVINAKTDLDRPALMQLVADAVSAAPANALLRAALASEFLCDHNDQALEVQDLNRIAGACLPNPQAILDSIKADDCADVRDDIVTKLSQTEAVFGVEGGAGTSLQADQSRQLHIRGLIHRRSDGLLENKVQLYKPIGSVFRFLGDSAPQFGGTGRAPSGLAYLSAGLAFCYLTQIGRFAHIKKLPLSHYSLHQDTRFSLPGASSGTMEVASAKAVQSHVHIRSDAPDAEIAHLMIMAEQTCFLHAACRTALKLKIRVQPLAG
ncbi:MULTISPECIES: OsmC family protein [unclassified Iodidimonas]|uniref:OsmC-related (seleno)protein n=1 Tax=unclassified Iodidimonas TaxID=2626145 RepID=UPI002482AED9|nr:MULTISPECIES: OsmC family protein [unclassified Iodidimonas]